MERIGQLTVVELDRDLAARLRAPQLEVVESDVLKVDFQALAGRAGPQKSARGGQPALQHFHPILFHLLETVDAIEDQHFMLQKR